MFLFFFIFHVKQFWYTVIEYKYYIFLTYNLKKSNINIIHINNWIKTIRNKVHIFQNNNKTWFMFIIRDRMLMTLKSIENDPK